MSENLIYFICSVVIIAGMGISIYSTLNQKVESVLDSMCEKLATLSYKVVKLEKQLADLEKENFSNKLKAQEYEGLKFMSYLIGKGYSKKTARMYKNYVKAIENGSPLKNDSYKSALKAWKEWKGE